MLPALPDQLPFEFDLDEGEPREVYAGPLSNVVSVSQIKMFAPSAKGCPRKWAMHYLAGFPRDGSGDFASIAFGHGYLGRCRLFFIHQYAEPPVKQLGFGYLRNHFRQFLLLQLKSADRPSKLHSFLTVTKGRVITVHRRSHRSPGNAVTRFGETAKRTFKAADLRK